MEMNFTIPLFMRKKIKDEKIFYNNFGNGSSGNNVFANFGRCS